MSTLASLPEPDKRGLLTYLEIILRINETLNLTAVRDRDEAIARHLEESLELVPAIRAIAAERGERRTPLRLVDVGTGGGFPGVPLAVALPDIEVELIEAREKKARAVETAIQEAGLRPLAVHADRVELLGQGALRERFDIAVARALADLPTLLELTLPLVRVGGCLLAVKGERAEEELSRSKRALRELGGELHSIERVPSATLVRIDKRSATPKRYPRRPGEPKRNPL